MSRFQEVQEVPPIEVFHVSKQYNESTNPKKVNLGIGAYRTEEGKPFVLPVVREAEKILVADESQNHEYLPILGYEPFSTAAAQLVFGADHPVLKNGQVISAQALSGTGSLRLGMDFLVKVCHLNTVLCSSPTWGNHKLLSKHAGVTNVMDYRYWDQATRTFNLAGMLEDLKNAPNSSIVLLHGCAHNPTGMDPTQEQWGQICQVIKDKKHFPFIDIAYQGFASGDPDKDAWTVRFFASQGVEMLVAQSFAKNFGLYNERTGNLNLVVNDPKVIPALKSHLSTLVRANWSNPPNHGAKVVHMILTNAAMRAKWMENIKEMSGRIIEMRAKLRARLEENKTPGTWTHITQQIGMFSFTGLSEPQVQVLKEKYHIFLLKNGRISMCGLNTKNVNYVADAMDDAVRNA